MKGGTGTAQAVGDSEQLRQQWLARRAFPYLAALLTRRAVYPIAKPLTRARRGATMPRSSTLRNWGNACYEPENCRVPA